MGTVKPFQHYNSSKECYLQYSKTLSGPITNMSVTEVLGKFNVTLMCSNITESLAKSTSAIQTTKALTPVSNLVKTSPRLNPLEDLVVYHVSDTVGHGVYSNKFIKAGTFITEYVGHRFTPPILCRMGLTKKDCPDSSYFFNTMIGQKLAIGVFDGRNINPHFATIDSKYEGDISRFINHCPNTHHEPNVQEANLNIGTLPDDSKGENWLIHLIARKDIEPNTPLCFDYGTTYGSMGETALFNKNTFEIIEDL